METRLLARILAAARSVQTLMPVAAARPAEPATTDASSVRAQVISRLADGSFQLVIDGKAVTAVLPRHVQPGDVVELRLLPRAAPRAQAEAQESAPEHLSGTARVIADALGSNRLPSVQRHPILPAPPEHASVLREPLARAVETSGLFYESHQARWVDGEFPLERLREEPQARLGAGAGAEGADAANDAAGSLPLRLPAASAPSDAETQGRVGTTTPAASASGEDRPSEPVARETLPIVRQQLEALDSRQVTWVGEIWPGQTMRWEIGEHEPGPEHDGEPAAWTTSLALELALLGDIAASLAIGADGARIKIRTASVHSTDVLRAGVPELAQALAAAGVAVASVEVENREHAV